MRTLRVLACLGRLLPALLLGACGSGDEATESGIIRITNGTTCEFTCGRTWVDDVSVEDLCGSSPFPAGETRETDPFPLGSRVRIELYVPSGCARSFEVVVDRAFVTVDLT